MIDVTVPYDRDFTVRASADEAYALVADIERSSSHFPGLLRVEPVDGTGRWRWHMEEKGVGAIKFTVQYDAVYTVDADSRTVRWSPPAKGAGEMESRGSWTIFEDGDGAKLEFRSVTVAHVPAPRLMRGMVDVIANDELSKLMAAYTDAIRATLNA